MAKTRKELEREIAGYKKEIEKEEKYSKELEEKRRLNNELFKLKNRRLIATGSKAKSIASKIGSAFLRAGKKATPIVKKQIRLIREQQLRDEAIERARNRNRSILKPINVSKVRKLKKGKKNIKMNKRMVRRTQSDMGVFSNLDF